MTSQPLFQNIFTLRRPRVAFFADIIKIVKIIFEDLKKLKQKLCTQMESIFLDIAKFLISGKEMLTSTELKGSVT